MVKKITNKYRNIAFKFLALQFGLGILIVTFVGMFWEVSTAQSFMIGVMLDLLPSFVFTVYAFRFSGATQIQMVAASFYRGETVKIMLTGALFIAVIKFVPVEFPALFFGFLITKISQFLKTIFF